MVKETENTTPKLVNQPNAVPTNKVTSQAVGAALAAIVMEIIREYFGFGFESGSAIDRSLPILFGAIVGYFMKDFANIPTTKED